MKNLSKAILACILIVLTAAQSILPAKAVTIYESDGIYHEEGYIFVGESHVGLLARTIGGQTNAEGDMNELFGIRFLYRENDSVSVLEDGKPNTMYMKGNVFLYMRAGMGETTLLHRRTGARSRRGACA